MNEKTKARVERLKKGGVPNTKLYIPHGDEEIVFAYPSFLGSYQRVGKQILEHGLIIPTAEETVSLLHIAYCSRLKAKSEFENIRDIMRDYWVAVFNRKLWMENGVYTIFDPEVKGKGEQLTIDDLEKRLKNGKEIKGIEIRISEDGIVRFAPKGSYKLGDHTSDSLSKDGNVISEYGREVAEKLGEITTQLGRNPTVWGLNIKKEEYPELRFSALGVCESRLDIRGSFTGGGGHLFGILKKVETI